MLAVVVPAHNEEGLLRSCLAAIGAAARHAGLADEKVLTVVVADACSDGTSPVALDCGAQVVEVRHANVGMARAAGASFALEQGARWLAFTDADTVVSEHWLWAQLSLGADAVCGTVQVDDWSAYAPAVEAQHRETYRDQDDHRHIHGANLGVASQAYRRVGGFPPLPCHEDVALVQALVRSGARIAWSAIPRVVTSARTDFRIQNGFGAAIARVQAELAAGIQAAALP